LDTSAFIAGFDPSLIQNTVYSVPLVKKELISGSLAYLRFQTAVENGKLKVLEPKEQFLETVKQQAKKVGDFRYLSEADIQVLALALQLKSSGKDSVIVTDDYSMQNVANKLKVEFASLITFGIKFQFKWILYCPACHKKYSSDYKLKTCKICGTKLKRKPIGKRHVKSRGQ